MGQLSKGASYETPNSTKSSFTESVSTTCADSVELTRSEADARAASTVKRADASASSVSTEEQSALSLVTGDTSMAMVNDWEPKALASVPGEVPGVNENFEEPADLALCETQLELNQNIQAFLPLPNLLFPSIYGNLYLTPLPVALASPQVVMNQQVDLLLAALSPTENLEQREGSLQDVNPLQGICPTSILEQYYQSGDLQKVHSLQSTDSRSQGCQISDGEHAGNMKDQLEALQLEDPTATFIVRGIKTLGFSSATSLKAHFSRYGKVKAVYVSHSRVKSMHTYGGELRCKHAYTRRRAASLGFVVMSSPKAAAQILAEGPAQNVDGVSVRLQPFHSPGYGRENGSEQGTETCLSDDSGGKGKTIAPLISEQ